MKNNILKQNKSNRPNNSAVYSCYNYHLILKLIINSIRNKKRIKTTLGTKRFNFECENQYPEISIAEIEDFEYLSFYFVQVAKRYYKKLFKLKEEDVFGLPNESQACLNIRYLISLIEITLKSIPKNKFTFYSSSSGNKVLDALFKKYYQKKYSIKIKIDLFSKIIKPSNDLCFDYKRLALDKTAFIKPFLKSKISKTLYISDKAFIHHKNLKNQEAYYKLKKDLDNTNNFISLDYLSMYEYGNQKKIILIINVIRFIVYLLRNNIWKIVLNNYFNEILEIISCKIYYLCCLNTIKSLNLKYIICSYISLKHEKILYQACWDTNTISIFYDFSTGFPININHPGNSQVDLIRNPNYIFTFGEQRCFQYKLVARSKGKNIIIKNVLCPQIEFAREQITKNENLNKKVFLNKYNSNKVKISIFDSLYGFNYHIKKNDVVSCINSLESSKLDKLILMHNKRDGFLKTYLQNSKLIYIPQGKGNFTNCYYSDLIISLGFQGAAIKSAFAFNKPIIFFTENNNFFKESHFLFDKKHNEKIIFLINNLTFNGEKLIKSIESKFEYTEFKSKINNYSVELFEELKLNELISAHSSINKIINE